MTNLDSVLKSGDITSLTKVRIVKAVVFPVVMYGSESWTRKKAWRIYSFELRCWRKLLGVPWTTKRPNQSILKEISPRYSLEVLMALATRCKELTRLKRPWCWERLKEGRRRGLEDEMVGWHHQLNGHEFEQTPRDSEGQGNLVCCSTWGHKESDTTEWLTTTW